MKTLNQMRVFKFLAGSALLVMASAAQSQYVWINEKGVKQVSDRAPPGHTPLKNILKSPRPIADPVDSGATTEPAKTAPKPVEMSTADREAEHRKRMLAKAEQDKEAAEKAAIQAQRAVACNAARAARAQLDHGRRLRAPDGSYLDDTQRAQQAARANSILQDCARG